jgi:hypothetical protein
MDDIAKRVANLSPAKRALFELRLKKKSSISAEPLAYQSSIEDIAQQVTNLSPAKRALFELRLKKKVEILEATTDRIPTSIPETEPEVTDWSADLTASTGPDDAQSGALNWLADTPFATVETPNWLMDTPRTGGQRDEAQDSVAPTEMAETEISSAITQPAPAGNLSSWLETLSPTDKIIAEGIDNKTSETTGILAGLSNLLPAEKVSIPSPKREDQPDDLLQATQEFYEIATQAPQPATLPTSLRRREEGISRVLRGVLYLLFMALVAFPLLDTSKQVPWTEPAGLSNDILDSQRRQLISEQLGLIDLQQPDSVALVSFDYSTATQGEMQPMAKAVLGRLKGQGMRIMAMSLEPEGAIIAQKTINELLEKRDEKYGASVVNLGYRPGQAAAIRELVTAQNVFVDITDFNEGKKPAELSQATWSKVNDLGQVNVIVTLADNPATARWWVEQLEMVPQPASGRRFLLAATSASAAPFLQPYRDSNQLNGLISGINGAAAIEAGRNSFGPARQMIDSQSIAHLIIVILIAVGIIAGWMPPESPVSTATNQKDSQNDSITNEEMEM